MKIMEFKLGSAVGDGLKSEPADVRMLRASLMRLGYKDPNPDNPLIDKNLDKNIRSFQKDNNLKVDGLVVPAGETALKIYQAMARSPMIRCTVCGAPHGGSQGDLCPDCATK